MTTSDPIETCGCHDCKCLRDGAHKANQFMIVCDICGNKRCPHATNHQYGCTHSNEPGQRGSRFKKSANKLAAVAWLLASLLGCNSQAAETPNVIVVLADDLGWGEIQPYGAAKVKTPALNQMAAEGMKFTSFYASTVCSMSRACLMTGCYNARVSIPGVLYPNSAIGLNPNETTLAEICKSNGYATACFGKWHLGHRDPFLPTEQGFDEYLGIPYSHDLSLDTKHARFAPDCLFRDGYTAESAILKAVAKKVPLVRGNEIIEYPADHSTLTKRYTSEAVRFIQDNADTPFLLYLPHSFPHSPLASSPEFTGVSAAGARGDVIEELDWSVGEILRTLADLGLDSSTLVVFTSDNGPPISGLSGPFTGVKGTSREGGNRVSCLMRWPGHIPAGTTCDRITGTIDILPTVASLLGAELPPVTLDGADISSLLLDADAGPVRDTQLYYSGPTIKAIRQGDWKLILPEGAATNSLLYNLAVALPERTDLASANPELAAKMKAEALSRDAEIKASIRPAGITTK